MAKKKEKKEYYTLDLICSNCGTDNPKRKIEKGKSALHSKEILCSYCGCDGLYRKSEPRKTESQRD